jgi:hypothetical protein
MADRNPRWRTVAVCHHYRQSMAGLVSAGAIIDDADGTPIPPAARLPTAAWPPMVCITGRRD